MKKMTYALMIGSGLALSAVVVAWAQTAATPAAAPVAPATGQTTTTTQPVTAASTTAPVAPKAPGAPVAAVQTPSVPVAAAPAAPQVTAPQAAATTKPVVAAPTAAVPVTAAASAKEPPVGIGSVPKDPKVVKGAPEDLRQAVQSGEFLKKLSFPFTETQMVEFARAAVKVGKINSKWDVQIASAEADSMAIEYNNLAVEEIEHSLKSIPGLTLDQYNELTRMTTTDPEFNSIYLAYKQLVLEGAFGEIPKGGTIPAGSKTDTPKEPTGNTAVYGTASAPITTLKPNTNTASTGGAALPEASPKPASTPANPGTVATPPGSPTPPYSPPATR